MVCDGKGEAKEELFLPRLKMLPKADYLIQDLQLSLNEWSSMTGDRGNLVTFGSLETDPSDQNYVLKYDSPSFITLQEMMSMKREKSISLEDVYRILSSVMNGLKTIHENQVRHGSLTPETIIVEPNKVVVDDGIELLCKVMHNKRKSDLKPTPKTHHYMSPEEFFVSKPLTKATDIYHFGLLMYFLLTDGENPWSEESIFSVQNKVTTLKLTPLVNKNLSMIPMPETLFRLMVQCLSYEPEHRPSASVILTVLTSLPLTILSLDMDYVSGEVETNKKRASVIEEAQRTEYYNKMQNLNAEPSWFESLKQCVYSALFSCCR